MKWIIPLIFLLLIGCAADVEESSDAVDTETAITEPVETETQEVEVVSELETEPETEYREEKTLFKNTLHFTQVNDTTKGKVVRNELTKTAYAELVVPIDDEEEYVDLMGSTMTGVPMMINMLCELGNKRFIDKEGFDEWEQDMTEALDEFNEEFGNATEEPEEPVEEDTTIDDFLEGYTVTKSTILFIDLESNEKIARCTATGKEISDIKFDVYRDYSGVDSLFNMVIGELEEGEYDEEEFEW